MRYGCMIRSTEKPDLLLNADARVPCFCAGSWMRAGERHV